ncbi:hypothetical protein TNCV_1549061 [Trichonephila clavipes]|nr:hypothetical protein TNCV_1549061 [Trichonephila clavipes]
MQNISLKYPGRVQRFLFERQSLNHLFIKLTGGTYRILSLRDNHRDPNLPTQLKCGAKQPLSSRGKHRLIWRGTRTGAVLGSNRGY